MILLNFAHPLSADHLVAIEGLTGGTIADVVEEPTQTHIDTDAPVAPQITRIVDAFALSPEQWQTAALLINPPGYAPAAATLMAELHGRIGYFPAIIRMRPVPGSTPPQFEVAEIINLQAVRDTARDKRTAASNN